MDVSIDTNTLKQIKSAYTASGKPVEYVKWDRWRKMHVLYINKELCYYSDNSLETTTFFTNKS